MTSPAELYVNGIREKFKIYHAAWLPNVTLHLGDIGVLQDNFFIQVTSLKNLGIDFNERPDTDSTPIDLVSESGVGITFKSAGQLNPNLTNLPQAEAGVGVEFSEQGAFVFNAPESYEPSIENIAQLQEQLVQAYKEGRWKSRWVVIVRLVYTPTATIIVSNSSKSKLELGAKGNIDGAWFNLGDANITLSVNHQSGDVLKMLGAKNITPLFQVAGIKRRTWPWEEPYSYVGSKKIGTSAMRVPKMAVQKEAALSVSPLDMVTPEMAKREKAIAESLYLDLY